MPGIFLFRCIFLRQCTLKLITLSLRRLQHARGAQEAFPVGAGGVQARGKLSLNAFLNMGKESQDAVEKLGGALLDVDEPTPVEVTEFMAKVKFARDCVVLKV